MSLAAPDRGLLQPGTTAAHGGKHCSWWRACDAAGAVTAWLPRLLQQPRPQPARRFCRRGVRLQFNRLIENNLLLVEASNGDRRSKRVRLSPSSIQLFEQIALIVGGDERVHPDAISPSHNGRAAGQALPIADSPRL